MVTCARCCLHNSIRAVNVIINLCGVAMIIYSLWLLRKWQDGVAELPSVESLPRPWFIYTCLGVGIAVCLSTLSGHMVANCISNYTICIYIVSICSLFLLQVAVIVAIFFKIDWAQKLAKYIDAHHKKFQAFVIFHLKMCRLILITILVPQINVIVLAVLLWALGTETRTPRTYRKISGFNYSFLLRPNSPILDDSTQICRQCEVLSRGDQRRSFLAYFSGVFRRRSQGRIIIC